MSVRFVYDEPEGITALMDSVTGFAFGPTFGSPEEAQAFLDFLPADARTFSDTELENYLRRFVNYGDKKDEGVWGG